MNKEEIKAIEKLKETQDSYLKDELDYAIETVLNLIQKQEKIIDKMAEKMVEDKDWFYSEFDNYTKQDFIEYFKKVVDEECEK